MLPARSNTEEILPHPKSRWITRGSSHGRALGALLDECFFRQRTVTEACTLVQCRAEEGTAANVCYVASAILSSRHSTQRWQGGRHPGE